MSFSRFNFHPRVAAGIEAAQFVTPTAIQNEAIPQVLAGRDVLGLAQTGTGKTAAFALPLLQRLMRGPRGRVRALVLAPTRELAEQIHEAVTTLGARTGLRSVTVYGGVNIRSQIARLKAGAEIVVACPGRLLDHIGQGTIDLSGVELLVLDEADQMFDMGFLPDIRRILKQLPAERQSLLFSATMPDAIRRLAHEVLRKPVTVQVANSAPPATVSHALYPVEAKRKTALLLALLAGVESGSVLIFTRTKHRAKRLGQQLEKAGHRAASLQGNLSQNRRRQALDGFRSGRYQVLVATDIAARGIDVSQVSHVINYDIPATPEAYVHRIGRTGRAARSGDAFTLVGPEDAAQVRAIEKALGTRLERRRLAGFDEGAAGAARDAVPSRRATRPSATGRGSAASRSRRGGRMTAGRGLAGAPA